MSAFRSPPNWDGNACIRTPRTVLLEIRNGRYWHFCDIQALRNKVRC
jgi:hypothetical protein